MQGDDARLVDCGPGVADAVGPRAAKLDVVRVACDQRHPRLGATLDERVVRGVGEERYELRVGGVEDGHRVKLLLERRLDVPIGLEHLREPLGAHALDHVGKIDRENAERVPQAALGPRHELLELMASRHVAELGGGRGGAGARVPVCEELPVVEGAGADARGEAPALEVS